MSRLDVCLFGPPDVRVDGDPIPPPRTRKGLWILCLLALRAEHEVDRNWLAGTLWPDSTQEDALANLRRSLTDLRRALGPAGDLLESPSLSSLRLAGAQVDLARFDALRAGDSPEGWREALELGRKPLLEGCDEEWAGEERTFREAACVELAERLGERLFSEGRFAEAADSFAEAARKDPFRESAWRRRMQSLEQAGALGGALETFRMLRDQLWEGLHTAPSPETTEVYQAIRHAARHRPAGTVAALGRQSQAPIPPAIQLPVPAHGRLPSPLTGLIGREDELRGLTREVLSSRLLTLTGSGGVGKTRLALEVARAAEPDFPGGGWWVELAPLAARASESLILLAIASAAGLREEPGVDTIESLARRWSGQKTLLVLDNCEHLVEQSSAVARALLQRTPTVTILATSRQPLELPGDW
jgi:DNA-binding SARP family transcriptional activator